ncbi:MAG: Sapep family Mn(2+)-dependent dipeptidase [Clostridia bacterium]|nr:Sapep family Mn(2+)-dependent dipeptidase [Clostridia bacterium]
MTNKEFDILLDEWTAAHKDEMIEELGKWVAIPSVSRADLAAQGAPYGPECKRMLDFALERGEYYGFKTENHEGYTGSIIYGDSDEEIGFACHLDVVPEGQHWKYAPYEMHEENGFLIGRGVSDDKGPTISCLFLMRFFKENNIPLKNTLRLMAGLAEETGMDDFKWYVNEYKGKVPKFSIVADCGFPVCFAQKGGFDAAYRIPAGKNIVDIFAGNVRNAIPDEATMTVNGVSLEKAGEILAGVEDVKLEDDNGNVKITAFGKGGHAASPDGKKNALVYLCQVASKLEDEAGLDLNGVKFIAESFWSPYGEGCGIDKDDEEIGKLTINSGVIRNHGDEYQLEIDIRWPHSTTAEFLEAQLKAQGEKFGCRLINVDVAKPYYISREDPKVKTLLGVYNELTGESAEAYAMGGGTYSRVIPNAMSFGPGFMHGGHKPDFLPEGHGGAHGPDEVNCIEDWLKSFKIYVKSVYEVDKII